MIKKLVWFVLFAPLMSSILYGQDIAGDWQGTLHTGTQDLRTIVQIAKANDGGTSGTMYSIDQTTNPMPISSVTFEGANLRFKVEVVRGSYEGKLSEDGASIEGTWTQLRSLPLKLQRTNKETAWPIDPTPHTVQFITVDKDVKLEVVDWGGTGRPLVMLTGLGDNAHVYDKFAPKLTGNYHVYGISRRGFGASSVPTTGYSADRLGDDVLAVVDALKLNRPVLVGHSIAGEELSSVGSRHPEKVAGLIYLDAAYPYAYYDRTVGDLSIDLAELQKKLGQLQLGSAPQDPKQLVQDLLEAGLPGFERDLREMQKDMEAMPPPPPDPRGPAAMPGVGQAIIAGMQKYTNISVPILAIYVMPHSPPPNIANDPIARAAFEARDEARSGAQASAFEKGVPTAHVVRLPHANHYVFRSNEQDVLREMNAFLVTLPPSKPLE